MAEELKENADLFRIRPTTWALRESAVGELFQTWDEKLWVISQLKLLRHWPLTWSRQEEFGLDLDFSRVDCAGQEFYELRLHDARLSHGGNLRVFFWVYDEARTIWILHAYWKKTQRLSESVKRCAARRLRGLKGQIQDGSIDE